MPKKELHIGQIIRNARIGAGLSQMQLAEKVGLSYQQIQKYEKGASEINISRLYQIAEALGLPVNLFLEEKNLVVSEAPSFYGKLSEEEMDILRFYRKIKSVKLKKMIIVVIKAIAEQSN
jgi:transcriptional regulator with XRE-family HTH domain